MIMDGVTQQHYSIQVPLRGSLQHVLDKYNSVLDYLQCLLDTIKERTSFENVLRDRYQANSDSIARTLLLNGFEAWTVQMWCFHQHKVTRDLPARPGSTHSELFDCIYYMCSEIRNEINQMNSDADEEDVERACAVYKRAKVIRERTWL